MTTRPRSPTPYALIHTTPGPTPAQIGAKAGQNCLPRELTGNRVPHPSLAPRIDPPLAGVWRPCPPPRSLPTPVTRTRLRAKSTFRRPGPVWQHAEVERHTIPSLIIACVHRRETCATIRLVVEPVDCRGTHNALMYSNRPGGGGGGDLRGT